MFAFAGLRVEADIARGGVVGAGGAGLKPAAAPGIMPSVPLRALEVTHLPQTPEGSW